MIKILLSSLFVVVTASAACADATSDCEQDKDSDRTIRGCTILIRQDPKDHIAFYNRGNAYDNKGDPDRAIADYSKAIELNPKYISAYVNRGAAYASKGDPDRAMADYNKAIEFDPKDAMAYYNRGNAYDKKGDNDRAIADYSKTLQLDPDYISAYVNRGIAYDNKGDHDRAIADYNKAIELDPEYSSAYVNRGMAYHNKGDDGRAMADTNTAIELDPNDATAYYNRGNAYDAKGERDRAIADYNKAIELDPKNSDYVGALGVAKYAWGDFPGAAAELLRAVEMDDIYAMLLRYLARTRAGETAAPELEANASRLKTKDWPYPVIELYLGKRNPEATLTSASKPDERCEANFYVGAWHLLQGNRDEAARGLQLAKDTCGPGIFEYRAAVADLQRLDDATKGAKAVAPQKTNAPDLAASATPERDGGVINGGAEKDDGAKVATTEMTPGHVFRDCPICPELVIVPAGEFMFGVPAPARLGRIKQRKATIASSFAVGTREVMRDEFTAFVSETGYAIGENCSTITKRADGLWTQTGRSYLNPGFGQSGSHPVVCISWQDADAYVKWLSKKTKRNYRLPTEEEWEYAARGGTTGEYYFDHPKQVCRFENTDKCRDGFANTSPVASFAPNSFGLYDVAANVREIMEDRSVRGATFHSEKALLDERMTVQRDDRNGDTGFRVVRDVGQAPDDAQLPSEQVAHTANPDGAPQIDEIGGVGGSDVVRDCDQTIDHDRTISGCSILIEKDPHDSIAYVNRALAKSRKGDVDGSIADSDRAIEADPLNAGAYSNRGAAYMDKKGDNARALADFNRAIEIDPKYVDAYVNRGQLYSRAKDYDRSNSDFDKAIELDPKNVDAWYARGLNYDVTGDSARGETYYTKAIELNPEYSSAYINRGIVYTDKGEYDRAIADFNKAIELDPKDAKAVYNRGSAYHDKGDHEHAMADYNTAIELDPKYTSAYVNRGIGYYDKSDYDRAITDVNKAIELDPKYTKAYNIRANAYTGKGEYDLAIADFNKAIELDPKDAAYITSRGIAKFSKGYFKDAAADFLRSIEIEDDGYRVLYLFLARARAGEATGSELEANAGRLKSKDWPYPSIELHLGKRNPEATLSSANKPNELCEAHFYIGEWHLIHGRSNEAAKSLAIAKDICPKEFVEYTASVAELQRLDHTSEESKPVATQGTIEKRDGDAAATSRTTASQEMEISFWNTVKDSDDPAMLQAYLDQFPDGTFTPLAKIKFKKLKPEGGQAEQKHPAAETKQTRAAIGSEEMRPGEVFRDCPDICPEMVVVPAGELMMGLSTEEKFDEKIERLHSGSTRHVTISLPYAASRFEVTFAEWDACVAEGGCKLQPKDHGWGRGKHPVINVSWNDIKSEYLPWLNRATGKTYRLLTEAEWEFAARAGTTTRFSTGASISTDQANYNGDYTYAGGDKGTFRKMTMEVGSFEPNAYGIYDMHGNVWELVEDCYHETYEQAPADGSAWTANCNSEGGRGIRGGSWGNEPQYLRSGAWDGAPPGHRGSGLGFRVARTLTLAPRSSLPPPLEPGSEKADRTPADAERQRQDLEAKEKAEAEERQRLALLKEEEDRKNPFKGKWGNTKTACTAAYAARKTSDVSVIFGAAAAQYMRRTWDKNYNCPLAKILSSGNEYTFEASCVTGYNDKHGDLLLKAANSKLTGTGPDGKALDLVECE